LKLRNDALVGQIWEHLQTCREAEQQSHKQQERNKPKIVAEKDQPIAEEEGRTSTGRAAGIEGDENKPLNENKSDS